MSDEMMLLLRPLHLCNYVETCDPCVMALLKEVCFFGCQVQFQEETLEEDKVGSVVWPITLLASPEPSVGPPTRAWREAMASGTAVSLYR